MRKNEVLKYETNTIMSKSFSRLLNIDLKRSVTLKTAENKIIIINLVLDAS